MNKKILLGLFLVSLFVFGAITPLVAAKEYNSKLLIPDAAVGIKTQAEVKTCNMKGWEEDISDNVDPGLIYGGDADVVGAISQGKILLMEEREVDIFELIVIASALDADGEKHLMDSRTDIIAGAMTPGLIWGATTPDVDLGKDKYSIWYLEIDKWDYSSDDLYDDPDAKSVPGWIFQDPEDIGLFYDELNVVMFSIQMSQDVEDNDDSGDNTQILTNPGNWFYYSAKDVLYGMFAVSGLPMAGPSVRKYMDIFMESIQEASRAGEYITTPTIIGLTPGQFLYGGDKNIDTTLEDVKLDGLKVTFEFTEDELLPLAMDSEDGYGRNQYYARAENDFNIVAKYNSETGTRSSVEWIAEHDDEVLFKIEGLPVDIMQVIPGYALSIVLLASAITAIGMIYIVMKKIRK